MDRNSLFEEINRRRRDKFLTPLSKEEFIAAISSLEARGFIITEDEQCHANEKYYQEVA